MVFNPRSPFSSPSSALSTRSNMLYIRANSQNTLPTQPQNVNDSLTESPFFLFLPRVHMSILTSQLPFSYSIEIKFNDFLTALK